MGVALSELGALSLFEDCEPTDLERVANAVTGVRHVLEGEVVCAEGDRADRWWIVAEGMADVTVAGLYTGTIGPGESIGELALLDGEPRGATVTAATDMELHEVDGDQFVEALLASPRLAIALLREVATRLRTTNRRPAVPTRPVPTARPAVVARPSPSKPSAIAQPSQLDPLAPGYIDDPSVQLAALREHAPVHWSDVIQSYVVTRYEDVHRMTRDRSLLGSVTTLDPPHVEPRQRGRKMMIRRDGADHLRLRRLVSKVFTPKAIGRWEERSHTIVLGLLDGLAERDEFEVMADYALIVPAQIISEMLGMPTHDMRQLQIWSYTLSRGLDPFTTPEETAAADEAGKAMSGYLNDVIAERRGTGGDDILAALLDAQDAGEILDDEEVVAQVLMLYIAGHETTRNLIGNGLVHLFRFPEQADRLRTDPALDANAIEEVLRFESPAQLTRRVNHEPVDVGGTTIPAGSHITLSLASANRDPRKWGPTADVLDISRPGANEHVSFGGGPHFCLGNSLARLEARVALPALVRRFPRMVPVDDEPAWAHRMVLRGVETLPVTTR
jgi:cytochrome P450